MNSPLTIDTAGQRAELERQQAHTEAALDLVMQLLWLALLALGATLACTL